MINYGILRYPLFRQTHISGSPKTFSRTVTRTDTKHVQKPALLNPCAFVGWGIQKPIQLRASYDVSKWEQLKSRLPTFTDMSVSSQIIWVCHLQK